MTAVDRPDNGQDEGRCSGDGCWYTLPLVDGLIVSHSAPMTLDNCEGSGRSPLASGRAGAGEQQREQVARLLAEADQAHREFGTSCSCGYRVPADEQPVWLVAMQTHRYRVRADELLALLGGPQPDGEAVELAQLATCSDRHTDGDLTMYCEQIPGHVGPHVNHRTYW